MGAGLTVAGLDRANAMIAQLFGAVQDTETVRRLMGEEMLLRTQERFAAGMAPDGSAWPPSARVMGAGGQTLWDHGNLLTSIHYELTGPDLVLYSDDIRARAHQEGLTITPTRAKALAIPLIAAVASAYQAGVSIREQYPEAFVMKSEAGNLFLARRNPAIDERLDRAARSGRYPRSIGSLSPLEFLFQLVSSVTEPRREFLGFSEGDLDQVTLILLRYIRTAEQGGRE